jgi:hypothetical protein
MRKRNKAVDKLIDIALDSYIADGCCDETGELTTEGIARLKAEVEAGIEAAIAAGFMKRIPGATPDLDRFPLTAKGVAYQMANGLSLDDGDLGNAADNWVSKVFRSQRSLPS